MRGLEGETKAGRVETDGETVFIHTGGLFGLFSYGEEIQALGS
jgi:1-aminocyclopropane-1-carboxylate deaminase/D-cysteine desulfhydrase-like pyridoxal-dependent ACC family enzyme